LTLGRAKEHWQQIVNSGSALDALSYYQLLGVTSDAPDDEISSVYYELVRVAHPDRHVREANEQRKRLMVLLYARMSEAYRVLSDPAQRQTYDQQLRSGAKRLSAHSPKPPLVDTRDPKTPKARELYEQAQQMIRDEDFRRARATLDLALQFEPDSRAIREALDAATPAHLKPAATTAPGPESPPSTAPAEPAPPAAPPSPPKPVEAPSHGAAPRGGERRRDPRHEIAHPVRVRCRSWSDFRTLYTRDISRGGMFLRTATPLLAGTAVQLVLSLPDGRDIELRGKVVHVVPPGTHGRPAGMGLRFSDMSEERRAQIEALLRTVAPAGDDHGTDPVLRQLLQELSRLRQASADVALRVSPDADPDVVRKAYLHLAKRTHPDLYCRYPGEGIQEAASEVFYLIRRAYERMRAASASVAEEPQPPPDGSSAVAGARRAWAAGDYARAALWLRHAVDSAPEDRFVRAAYHVAAGAAARGSGNEVDARKHFETALVFDKGCDEAISLLSTERVVSDAAAMFDRIRIGEEST